jgi:hypothetical protein
MNVLLCPGSLQVEPSATSQIGQTLPSAPAISIPSYELRDAVSIANVMLLLC